MGKRKSSRKAPPKFITPVLWVEAMEVASMKRVRDRAKAIMPLDTQFNCPFCNHEKVCEVKMDRERNLGFISCRVCMEDFQTPITYLSEPIDVYSDWIDACESANA